jgi:hypothetical protein
MTSDNLNLSTGVNWVSNACYNMNQPDQYWQIVSGPGIQDTVCATVWAYWQPAGGWVGLICPDGVSRVISNVNGGGVSLNSTNLICNGNNPYIFSRRFFVSSTIPILANLVFKADVDDGIFQVKIGGNILSNSNAPCINNNISAPCINSALNWNWNNITLQPGENTLEIEVENRSVGPSTMGLNVDATLSAVAANNVFVKNEYFMPNSRCYSLSSTLYPPVPTYTQNCVTLPSNTGQIMVTNYSQSFQYAVSPTVTMNGPNFNATAGTVYTISASNALGCSATATATLVVSPALNVSLNTNFLCIPPPPTTTVNIPITTTGGTPPYTYTVSPGGLPPIIGNTLKVNLAGIYTLTATDVYNCFSTTVIQVGNLFNLNLNMPSPCVGTTLTAQIAPALPNITYSLNGGTPQAGNTFTINAAGVYTVTATDPWGCTSMSTIQVFDNPQLQVVSDGVPCYPTFTVLNNSGAALLSSTWNDPFNLVSWVPSPPLLPTQFSPGAYQNPLPPAIIYTVTAVDVNGCTNTITVNYDPNPFCCQFQFQNIPNNSLSYFSNKPPYNNATASAIIAAYGNSTITNANLIAFDGDIMIDQDITFSGCPQMRCTFDTRFIVQPGVTLTFINCYVRAYCDGMWRGIFADEPNMRVIAYNSSFADMNDGFVMENGAHFECKDNTFTNNFVSVQLANTPTGYNASNGTCIIFNNVFTSSGIPLLFPHTTQIRPESGIRVDLCREVQIGGLQNGQGNHFEKSFNGVRIQNGPFTQTENYFLYNNTFFDIRRIPTVSSAMMLQKYAAWAITDHQGAAIYSLPKSVTTPAPTHHLIVEGSVENLNFDLCDRAISAHVTSATVKGQTVSRCLMGFLFPRCNDQRFNIQNNGITGNTSNPEEATVLGMRFVGNALNSTLINNHISLTDLASVWWTGTQYPIGIDIEYVTLDPNHGYYIEDSYITLNNASSIGIGLKNCSKMTDVYQNIINNYSNGTNGNNQVKSGGIFLENCQGTRIRGNDINGNNNLLATTNAYDAIQLNASTDCLIECNETFSTRRALRVYSNCSTGIDQVRGNTFDTHGYAMEFNDLGTQGTLGQIGEPNYDCRNYFFNAALFPPNTYGIYRFASITPFVDNIFTMYCPITYSWSNNPLGLNKYNIIQNPGAYPYVCPQSVYLMLVSPPQNSSNISIQQALDIALDSVEYTEFGETVSWMEKQRLFKALSGPDSVLLSNAELSQFYNNQILHHSDELLMVNRLLSTLSDSVIYLDTTMYKLRLQEIETLNNLISGNNSLEINEKLVNNYLLQWYRGELDVQNSEDSLFIDNLANSCPFVNGYGVYKARVLLHAFGNSTNLSDKYLCNAVGMYKNGRQEDEPEINPALIVDKKEVEIQLYPNPFNDELTIEYKLASGEKATFVLYDLVGKEVYRKDIESATNKVSLLVPELSKGVYFYKYSIKNGEQNYSGKLIKE